MSFFNESTPEEQLLNPKPEPEMCDDCPNIHPPKKPYLHWVFKTFVDGMLETSDELDKENWGRAMIMVTKLAHDMNEWARLVALDAMTSNPPTWGEPLDDRFPPGIPPFPGT